MKRIKHEPHKERGFWLSLILIVMALHGILGTVLYYTIRTQEALDRPWIVSLMALHSLANVIDLQFLVGCYGRNGILLNRYVKNMNKQEN